MSYREVETYLLIGNNPAGIKLVRPKKKNSEVAVSTALR
jgi:hypothetical protein